MGRRRPGCIHPTYALATPLPLQALADIHLDGAYDQTGGLENLFGPNEALGIDGGFQCDPSLTLGLSYDTQPDSTQSGIDEPFFGATAYGLSYLEGMPWPQFISPFLFQ